MAFRIFGTRGHFIFAKNEDECPQITAKAA